MLIYVALHIEVRHSHESFFHRQYNIPTCFSMLQCTFKVNNFHVLIYVAVHVLVSISHVLMLQCTWKYAILMSLFSIDSPIFLRAFPCCSARGSTPPLWSSACCWCCLGGTSVMWVTTGWSTQPGYRSWDTLSQVQFFVAPKMKRRSLGRMSSLYIRYKASCCGGGGGGLAGFPQRLWVTYMRLHPYTQSWHKIVKEKAERNGSICVLIKTCFFFKREIIV
jgi:hypothetical protein